MTAATAHSDLGPVRDLSVEDAARGAALSTAIGWNQVEADWRYMLGHGDGVGREGPDGALVASAMALPYGGFAWICMVLVAESHRRRGLATELMQIMMDRQTGAGRVPGLDATPAGREVYRRIGFVDHYGIGRYRAEAPAPAAAEVPPGIDVRPLGSDDVAALKAADSKAFGADRSALLRHLMERQPGRAFGAFRGEEMVGHALARNGREATQIGPVVAATEAIATALAAHALAGLGTPAYVDALDRHDGFVNWLKDSGFAFQRPYTRMYLDRDRGFDEPALIAAIAGPELG